VRHTLRPQRTNTTTHAVAAPDVAPDVEAQGVPHAVSATRPHNNTDVVRHVTVTHVVTHAVAALDVAYDMQAQGSPHAASATRPHNNANVVTHATAAHVTCMRKAGHTQCQQPLDRVHLRRQL
jgi:hypothetical protein